MFPLASALTLQSIPPSAAHLCLNVENFVQKELGHSLRSKRFLIGLSGGVDSTALLLIFFLLSKRNDFSVAAAHLNHGIRAEAQRDQEFCHHLCAHLSIPFFSQCIDVPALCKNGTALEEAARTARYNFFNSLHSAYSYDYLLTGHQLNDLAEDCFMRLLRGSGWPSLAGMPGYTQNRSQLRPLLLQPKESLESFLLELNIPHVVDATNTEYFTLRNRIRHQILPFFQTENPRFLERIAALWKQARMEEEDINVLLEPIFELTAKTLPSLAQSSAPQPISFQVIGSQTTSPLTAPPEGTPPQTPLHLADEKSLPATKVVTLSKLQLERLPKSIRLRAYKHVLDALGPGQILADTLLKLDKAWQQKKGNALFQFSHGKTAQIKKQSIVFKIN